jgi:hypothetical protein
MRAGGRNPTFFTRLRKLHNKEPLTRRECNHMRKGSRCTYRHLHVTHKHADGRQCQLNYVSKGSKVRPAHDGGTGENDGSLPSARTDKYYCYCPARNDEQGKQGEFHRGSHRTSHSCAEATGATRAEGTHSRPPATAEASSGLPATITKSTTIVDPWKPTKNNKRHAKRGGGAAKTGRTEDGARQSLRRSSRRYRA